MTGGAKQVLHDRVGLALQGGLHEAIFIKHGVVLEVDAILVPG